VPLAILELGRSRLGVVTLELLTEVRQSPSNPGLQVHLRLPVQEVTGGRDVRLPDLRVVGREREYLDRRSAARLVEDDVGELADRELDGVSDVHGPHLVRAEKSVDPLDLVLHIAEREVMLRQSVLTTLVQSYEQARIAEVRDTPVITVLEKPFLPPGPDERRLVLSAALGIVLGGMAGIVLVFLIEAFCRPVAGDQARKDFQDSWNGLMRSIPFVRRRRA